MGWVPGSRDQEQQGQWRLCLADGTGRGDCTWTCQRRGVGGWGEVRRESACLPLGEPGGPPMTPLLYPVGPRWLGWAPILSHISSHSQQRGEEAIFSEQMEKQQLASARVLSLG